MSSADISGPSVDSEMTENQLRIFRELAIAANELLPVGDTLHLLMDVLGRHYGSVKARVVALLETDIEGETEYAWQHPEKFKPHLHDQAWSERLTDVLSSKIDPYIIHDVPAHHDLHPYFPDLKPGIRGYVGAPIRIENIYSAAIEFLFDSPISNQPGTLEVLNHGVALIGLVIERSRAQARLRESERRFRGLFDQSIQFISLLKPDGTIIDVNSTILQFSKVAVMEFVGKKFWELPLWQYAPATMQEVHAAIQRAAQGEFIRFEATAQGGHGDKIIVDLSINAVSNRKGEIVLLILEGRDITDLRLALDHISLTERRLEEAQRIAQIGHWEYHLNEDRAAYSDTMWEIFGLDPDTTLATTDVFTKLIHPEDLSGLQRALNRSYQTGNPFELHFRILRPDGSIRMVYAAGGMISGETGEPMRMAGIIQDISGRRQLEDSLAHSVERLSGLNTMGQAVASSVDLDVIYRNVLSAGRKLLNAEAVILFSHQEKELFVSAIDQEGGIDLLGLRIPDNAGIAGECWSTGQPVWISGDECRERRSAKLVSSSGYEPSSIIAVPVGWQDEVLGVLEATHADEDIFDIGDVSMLQSVANWTAIAIGKASQHAALQRRLQESEAIAAVSRTLSQTLEPQAILEMIVNTAHDIVPRSDWAVIHLLRGRPERLDPAAVAGTDEDLSGYVIAYDEGIAGLAIREGRVLNVGNTQIDPRSSAYAQQIGLRSLLVAPIQSRSRALGTISLHCTQPSAFTFEDERLLTILAAQAGLAIENAQLFDSQRRARLIAELQREKLRILADRIVTAQEEERLRISRELHDEAGQSLTSLKISLDLIRTGLPPGLDALRARLADLAQLTGDTMETLRTLAHDLRPPGLDAFGLNIAMEGLCHDFSSRTNLPLKYQGTEIPDLPTTVALSMYRFAQEALTNIAKHAEASQVDVQLIQEHGNIRLSIADNGRGFNHDPESPGSNGIGLVSMQERIDLIGGVLEVFTAPGLGTRLVATIPLEANVDISIVR